jgi:hypothetical protein
MTIQIILCMVQLSNDSEDLAANSMDKDASVYLIVFFE